jgi:ketopantoate reductase
VDWLTGAVVREAQRLGIPAPIHETLYRLVKARESSWRRRPVTDIAHGSRA